MATKHSNKSSRTTDTAKTERPPAVDPVAHAIAVWTPEQTKIIDIYDEINCAISILRDLMALALQEAPAEIDNPCKAGAAIRAANRFIDDIEAINERLSALARQQ